MATGGIVTFKFEGDTKDLNNKINQTKDKVQSATSTIKDVVVGMGLAKIVSSAMSVITNSVDDAIKRVDTLNNFPKVMSNLGISSNKAQKSINKMSEELAGLPTTLDQGASAVQRFTSANGDVEKSTDIFLALNNAILAGGASADIQASALEQLSQAYSHGKPDMNEWRTAMTAMPAQLKQVAIAMGYASADELGESLRNGKVSMDAFMDSIIKLNEEGIDGFASFKKQSRDTVDGIGTSITVAKTQVVKGVADIITSIDKGLEDANLPSISEMIAEIGKNAKIVLDTIGEYIPPTISFLLEVYDNVKAAIPYIIAFVAAWEGIKLMSFIQQAGGVASALKLVTSALTKNTIAIIKDKLETIQLTLMYAKDFAVSIAQTTASLIKNTAQFIIQKGALIAQTVATKALTVAQWAMNAAMNANPIALVIVAIVALVAIIVILYKKCDWFRNGLNKIFEFIKRVFFDVINRIIDRWKWAFNTFKLYINLLKGILNAVISFVKNNWKTILLFLVNPFAGAFKLLYDKCGAFRNFVNNFVSRIKDAFTGMSNKIRLVINIITGVLSGAIDKIKNIGFDIVRGIGNGITNGISWIKGVIKDFVGNVTDFIKKMFKIGSPSKLMASEVGQWLPKGIAVGIDANTDSVKKAMDNVNADLLESSMFNINPNMIANASNTLSPNVNVVNNISMKQDPLGQMVRDIKTFSGGAKNDYNYGVGV